MGSRVVALVLLPVLLGACGGRLGHRIDASTQGVIPIPAGVHTVSISLPEGQLSFLPGSERQLEFRGETLKAADTAEQLELLQPLDVTPRAAGVRAGVLEILVPPLPAGADPQQAKIVAKLIVQMPPDLAIVAETNNGPLGVQGWRAGIQLRTSHGKLYLSDCEGDATLRGSGSPVVVDRHRGNLDAAGSEMMMQVFVERLGDRMLRLVNTYGSIQAHVPADASFELELIAEKGSATNSFGIPPQRGGDTVTMRGTVGAGGPKVHLQSVHRGNVSLRGTARD